MPNSAVGGNAGLHRTLVVETFPARHVDDLGRDLGHWQENYECQHCHKTVVIRLYAAWPEKCPRCGVWSPRLAVRSS